MVKVLSDYFEEYSYCEKNLRLLQIYQKLWEDGYKLGEYGKYLRNPYQFEEERLFSILKNIGMWKSGKWWLDQNFDQRWDFFKISKTLKNVIRMVGTHSRDAEILNIIAVNDKTKIPGFAKHAGSVILTVMYPDSYGIMDYRVWRALNDKWIEHYNLDFFCKFRKECENCYEVHCKYIQDTVNSSDFDLEECERYFQGIRKIATIENMNPRQVDMSLWEYDRQHSRCTRQ